MKQKNLAMLGVAIGCGLVAAVAVAKLSAGGSKGPETVRVLVAKKDLPLQTKLEEKELSNLLDWADVPKNIAPPDAATDLEQVKDKELNRTLKQGNPLSMTDLGKADRLQIPEGYKAMTVKATATDAVYGFAKPGAKVDIMFIEKTTTGKARAAIILRDMLVLAVNKVHTLDEKTGAAVEQVESATFAVTDKQATLLALANERGRITMVLRQKGLSELEEQADARGIEWVVDPFDQSAPPPRTEVKPMAKMVVARKPVAVNTLINADNVNEYFTTAEVKTAPAGVIENPADLKGLYVVKAIDEGQIVFKSLTDSKAMVTDPVKPAETTDTQPVVQKPKLPRFEQVIQEGGRAIRVIWVEVAPKKWKRFESEKEADEYTPEVESPKTESLKTDSGE